MENKNPSILSHVSIGTNDFARSVAFYDAVLPALGCRKLFENTDFGAVAYGKQFPEFWVQRPIDGQTASVGNGVHISFIAASKEAVHAFHESALAAGASDDGPPGARPQYSQGYYAAFVRDPDGHKIEATYFDASVGEHA